MENTLMSWNFAYLLHIIITAQKMKFSIMDFFIFCAVY